MHRKKTHIYIYERMEMPKMLAKKLSVGNVNIQAGKLNSVAILVKKCKTTLLFELLQS